jgi:hypothetical protein
MTEYDQKLADALLDSLILNWEENGNVSAGAVRDSCIRALSEVLGASFQEIVAMIDQRLESKQ